MESLTLEKEKSTPKSLKLPDPYLFVGKHSDLKDPTERYIYRSLEALPGILTLLTFFLVVLTSKFHPFLAAGFIIVFDVYWLIRVVYFSLVLYSGYRKTKENLTVDWLKKLKALKTSQIKVPGVKDYQDVLHLVVFPVYQETYQIVKESLLSLVNQKYPKDKILVVLAIEERSKVWSKELAQKIKAEFKEKFWEFFIVWHPDNLPGEIKGKGANETFALKKIKEEFIDELKIPLERVLVTSLDADTCLFPQYLACLTYHYLTLSDSLRCSFQPVPLYINNIFQAPFFSRVLAFSSTFWHTMNQERPDKLVTFSSHSLPLKALVKAGFKQVNVVSEDSRIFWQCFFAYRGNYRTHPLFYPVSMDAVATKSFIQTFKNLYRQQRRWAYGMENIPYVIFNLYKKKAPLNSRTLKLLFELLESNWSWATAPIIIFAMGFLPILLGGSNFQKSLLSYNLPKITSFLLTLSMIGIPLLVVISFQLISPVKEKRKVSGFIFQWLSLPFTMIFLSALPAIDAQMRWLFGKYLEFQSTPKER